MPVPDDRPKDLEDAPATSQGVTVAREAEQSNDGSDPSPLSERSDDAWDIPVRVPVSPTLHLDGFDGPIDVLLDLAERQRIDFGRMSIVHLAEQFVVAMEHFARQVPLERRADWLVLASRLVLLRSRLLFPESPKDQRRAEDAAADELQRIDTRVFLRAAAGWLTDRPQLGIDTFTCPPVEVPREGGYVALLEACLVVLRGTEHATEETPVYRPTITDLWRVTDALARITECLVVDPMGGGLATFLPPIAQDDPDLAIRARTAVASTLLAGLELARASALTIAQEAPMEEVWLRSDLLLAAEQVGPPT